MLYRRNEELWTAPAGVPYIIVVQANSEAIFTEEMRLERGAAVQARQIYPKLAGMMYRKIRACCPGLPLDGTQDYGFLPVVDPPAGIGIFQVRQQWGEAARLDTIQRSAEMLAEYAANHPGLHIRMTFPAPGERQSKREIQALLGCLPDNVHIADWVT